jgi:hypothetical protein
MTLFVRSVEFGEVIRIQFRVTTIGADGSMQFADSLPLDPDGAMLRRFRLLDHDPQRVGAVPAIVADLDTGHDLGLPALGALGVSHGCSPVPIRLPGL